MESNYISKDAPASVPNTPGRSKKKFFQSRISGSVPNTPTRSRKSRNSLGGSTSEGGTPIKKKRIFGESILQF